MLDLDVVSLMRSSQDLIEKGSGLALGPSTVIRDPQGATFIASKFVPQNMDLAA